MNISDHRYIRRLVKEIKNNYDNGVYYRGDRIWDVKFSENVMKIRTSQRGWQIVPHYRFHFLFDGYGRAVCASRGK